MRRHTGFAVLLALIIALFGVSTASAHRPVESNPEGVTAIPNPTTSYAYYEALDGGSEVDVYTFSGQAGQFFHAGINIPQIEGLETYGVSLALLGPGLPALSGERLPPVPHDHGENTGAHNHDDGATWTDRLGQDRLAGIIAPSERSADFFEPFTQTNYWGRQVVELDLPQTGAYHLLVWHPRGEAGKYVLDTGREEVFGAGDLLRFPVWWVQTHIYFGHTPGLIAGAAGVLLLAIGAFTAPSWLRRSRFWQPQERLAQSG